MIISPKKVWFDEDSMWVGPVSYTHLTLPTSGMV